MLKHAANLSSSYEYYFGWTGQSTARAWGSLQEARSLFAEFGQELVGFTGAAATSFTLSAGGHTVGSIEDVTVLPAVLVPGEWSNTKLRLGTVQDMLTGYAKILRNTAGTLTVQWLVAPTGGPAAQSAGYVFRDTFKWASYPQVRVLVPYQPVTDLSTDRFLPYPTPGGPFAPAATIPPAPPVFPGRGLRLPAPFTVPAGVTSFEDLGTFLDFSFAEGIAGYGISEGSDSTASPAAHPITAIAAGVWTFTNALPAAADKAFTDGRLIVDWEDATITKRSWAKITTSSPTTFTPDATSWLGDGPIANGEFAKVKRYTLWVPHWEDSPHSYIPGEGFTYATNEMQPGGFAGNLGNIQIRNRPRGIPNRAYGNTFGDMLVVASRLSSAIGKRVNVIHLGVNSAPLGPNNTYTSYGLDVIAGWYDPQLSSTWDPAISTSLYRRVTKLIAMVTNALLAEGSTKTAKCLGWVHLQGEGDALLGSARQHYYQSIRAFLTGIRNTIEAAGHNPYRNGAKVPMVQPQIMHLPYEIQGPTTYYGVPFTADGDSEGLVNSAITDHASSDGFCGTIFTDDLPRNLPDLGHCNGVGEAARGARIADRLGRLIEHALAHGPAAGVLNAPPARILEICNLALSHIGETAVLTSLDDGSVQAGFCRQFLPEARKSLLQVRQWGFALRRATLAPIRKPEEFLYQQFAFCYPVPAEALNAFRVLPPVTEVAPFNTDLVVSTAYSQLFVTQRGQQVPVSFELPVGVPVGFDQNMPDIPYVIEKSPLAGNRYLFTNQRQATLRYVADVVDAEAFSPAFATALSYWLGSMLAGAIIKGDQGEAVAARLMKKAGVAAGMAASSDGNQQRVIQPHIPDFLANR